MLDSGKPIKIEEVYHESLLYQPIRNEDLNVIENCADYVRRMKSSILPNWPEEVLGEWLHRHADFMDDYAFLDFQRFSFSEENWRLENIPGREAFRDPQFFDDFSDIQRRACEPYDWLAKFMLNEGTWNTPVVLLRNPMGKHRFSSGRCLSSPLHLLEGHRRLSFLNGLKAAQKAKPIHRVWLVTIGEE